MASDLAAAMKATAEGFVKAFDGKWSLDAAMAARAPECQHETLPVSLGIKARTNSEWAARFEHVKDLIIDGTMTIDDYLGVSEERRAVVRSTLAAESVVGAYNNEYIWFLTFDDSGRKIVKITEFMDTAAVADLRSRLAQNGVRGDQGV